MNTCKATTKTGAPCRAPVLRDGWCYHHHPDLEAERAAAKRKGGLMLHHGGKRERERPDVTLSSAHDVVRLLEIAAGDLLMRKPSANRARGLAYLAGIALKAVEAADLTERVEALEARLQLRKVP